MHQADVAGGAGDDAAAALLDVAHELGLPDERPRERDEIGGAVLDDGLHRLNSAQAPDADHRAAHALAQALRRRDEVGLRLLLGEDPVHELVGEGAAARDAGILERALGLVRHQSGRAL